MFDESMFAIGGAMRRVLASVGSVGDAYVAFVGAAQVDRISR
jgi:hypothetical protein